ncbi:MAG: 2-dehydropantoate 2-reductase [Gammaproteobacteria bacterium]|nr:2-dehydropantoate 2-reductase [Gammaproteobacteria bacterium]
MRIAIMGTGGVGGFFGAKLALAGHDVTLIARGAHLAAIRRDGLRVATDEGELHVAEAVATDDPGSIAPVEAVLFTTKLYDTETAARFLAPALGAQGYVVTVQNGITSADTLGEVLGRERVLAGTTHVVSHLAGPGRVHHMGKLKRIIFGEADGSLSERGRRFEAALVESGIDAELSPEIDRVLWEKFVPLSVMSGLASVVRAPIGVLLEDSETRALVESAIDEAVAVAHAMKVPLAADSAALFKKRLAGAPAATKPSMLVDLEAGRRLELPWFSATVARLGSELDVPTPTHAFIAAALHPHVQGRA